MDDNTIELELHRLGTQRNLAREERKQANDSLRQAAFVGFQRGMDYNEVHELIDNAVTREAVWHWQNFWAETDMPPTNKSLREINNEIIESAISFKKKNRHYENVNNDLKKIVSRAGVNGFTRKYISRTAGITLPTVRMWIGTPKKTWNPTRDHKPKKNDVG